ncbi:DUF2784 domain-containing protein [Phytomonospora endophytica]|uniref:DUF2784 domain-containing protein n=1 Tax=Phytomonospora endophytica TaxID=714109 RepID=A0A841FNK9_9ACTN|nr:DUF2784 domain-containing protein [Phytomonospora endophytica]MBB6033520.1 hypothetical protein [Phytomonospora endophytica]GIG64963.1 hypothetical protein Pen01_12580 [Phytomonospora endophytica]
MGYRIAGQAVMVVHFAVLIYLAVGGFLAWRWPKAWFAHLAMACWGLLAIAFPVVCPLTHLENEFRAKAGEAGLNPGGFIDTYIENVVYPEDSTVLVRWLVVAVVAVSWAGTLHLVLRRRRAREHVTAPS